MKLVSMLLLILLALSPAPATKSVRANIAHTGVTVNGEAYTVVQQPMGEYGITDDMGWISEQQDTFTRYDPAEWYNVTWLLIHSHKGGAEILGSLEIGDTVTVTLYGKTVRYTVTSIRVYAPSDVPFSALTMEPGLVMQTCAGDDRLIVRGE